jgi:TonB family protein
VRFLTIVEKRRRVLLFALVFTGLLASHVPVSTFAQAEQRKVKSRVEPTYPEMARRIGLTGVVKLQIVIAANGTVRETKVLGGHPLLIDPAVDAVKKWKFESASTESTGTVEFKFEPGR